MLLSDMVLLASQFVLLCLGIYLLCKGRMRMAQDRVLQGRPARISGVLLLLPLPLLMICARLFDRSLAGKELSPDELTNAMILAAVIKWGGLFSCAFLAYLVAVFASVPAAPPQPVTEQGPAQSASG